MPDLMLLIRTKTYKKSAIIPGFLILALMLLLIPTALSAATVTVNGNIKYQEIGGFEITILGLLESSDSYGMSVEYLGNRLINDFGFNIIKIREDMDVFEPVNDNSDPLDFNWDSYNKIFGQQKFSDWFRNIKSFYDKGARIHLSAFHAPGWMKVSSKKRHRYKLDPDYPRPDLYREIAELWAAPIVYMRDNYNVVVESIVVWNEPTDPWSPFRFSKSEYVETVKALGERFHAEKLNTKIIIGDDGFIRGSASTVKRVLNDPTALAYAGGIAYHTYDGFERKEPDKFISALKWLADDVKILRSGLELRMTEWAPTGNDPLTGQALVWAKHIYNCHVYGKTSVFDLWAMEPIKAWGENDPSGVSESDGSGGIRWRKHLYAVKQYAKYIDPDSKRIYAGLSGASNVYASAYWNENTGRFTIVVINRGTGQHTGKFNINNIQGLSTMDVIRTSASEDTANLGQVSVNDNSFSYSLPGQSVTTFTSKLSASVPLP